MPDSQQSHDKKWRLFKKTKKTLVMAWVPALSWRVTYHVAVLDTTRIHFCTIKNELV